MSYLLTEIALEMLGYKFYDTNGVHSQTNFQHSQRNVNSSEEQSLESILGLMRMPTDEETTDNVSSSQDNDNISMTPIVVNAATDEQVDVKNSAATATIESTNQTMPTVRSSIPPSALSKLLDYEGERIRSQIQRNKVLFLQSNAEAAKRLEQRGGGGDLAHEFLQPFVSQERENLRKEAQTMHNFRNMVERSLLKLNPESFDKYTRTFKRKQRSLGELKVRRLSSVTTKKD